MAVKQRLIDANALMKAIKADDVAWRFGVPNTMRLLFDHLRIIINEHPTADAVEVIRCKDCKYYELDEGDFLGECYCKRIPMNYSGELYPERDFFCAYGERK